jgi:uncharacterized membrane-anchored protein YjiN (DUF445 family)
MLKVKIVENKRRILRRNKTIAVGLMVAAAILFVIARLHKGLGYWEWVSAFSEAAMIGALADWFAVVALFKHPLGIPIPHTAIVPNKKNTIADSLAEFIRDKFLATESLVAKLRGFNPAERLSNFLYSEKNCDSVASGIIRIVAESLDFIDDDRVRKMFNSVVNNRVEKIDLSASTGSLLDFLRKDNRHQSVLDEILKRVAEWADLPDSQNKIASAIDKWANNEYPLLSRMIPNRDLFLKGAGEKVAKSINSFIQEVHANPDHELRETFDKSVTDLVHRLKNDDKLRGRIEAVKKDIVSNPAISDYINSLWIDMKKWLREDLDRENSTIRSKISGAAKNFGNALSKSPELKNSINEHLEMIVRNYAGGLRSGFSKHISGTIKQWEDDDFVSEIELSIGSDLQFIRMNGTLVGGLIGLLIHTVSILMG